MQLRQLINQFMRLKGGYPLLENSDSQIKLKIDEEVIAFEEALDPEYFYLFGVIDSIVPEKETAIMAEALSSNLFHKETGNASIGFDKETKALVLFQKISFVHMDEYKLQEIVSDFLAYLSFLKVKFEDINLSHKGLL